MDPTSIPPPATISAPISLFPAEPNTNNHVPLPTTANPTPPLPPVPVSAQTQAQPSDAAPNHPPYSEMIYAAIEALKEKNGSSKRAIAKYIEQAYNDLPPTHSALLTYHLQRLKNNGLLVMVKKSYKLPRSDGSPSTAQRGRGRPPKLKPQPGQAQALTQPQPDLQMDPVPNASQNLQNAEPVWVALGLADEPAEVKKRGPGRPRKTMVVEGVGLPGPVVRRGRPPGTGRSRLPKRPGRPPKPKSVMAISNGLKRRPGRPPKIQSKPTVIPFAAPAPTAPAVPTAQGTAPDATAPIVTPRRRGRPKKYGSVLPAVGAPSHAIARGRGRGRGRGVYRSSTGRPVGRPKKGTTTDLSAQKVAIEDLKRKLDYFQSKVKESLSVIKPHFNHESPVTAIAAIQDLEILATMDLNAPLTDDTQQLPQIPQSQLLPQSQPPPQHHHHQQQQPDFQPQQLSQQQMYHQPLPQPHMYQQPFPQPQIYQQQLQQPQMYQQQLPQVPLQSQPQQLFQPH